MRPLSKVAANIDGQPMFKYLDMARKLESTGKHLIHMEIGDPDLNTPHNIVNAAINSLQENNTHYCSSYGIPELRQAIRTVTEKRLGFLPDLNQVLVTPGANNSIFYTVFCLVDPGFEVIVPDPGFSTYYSTIKMCGAVPVRIPLKEENEFRMNPSDIEAAITDKTRLIVINSPQNPTGSLMTADEMKAVYDIAEKYDLYLYSDEIYERMVYTPDVTPSPSIYDQCKSRVILSNGFSKAFAMTGWRLGTLVAPENIIERMATLLQTTSSCVSPFIQEAGVEALLGEQHQVAEMMAIYKERRDILVSGLNSIPGISCLTPGGAFYVFPNITGTGLTSEQVCEELLDAGVVALPGTVFGEYGQGYIRLCYAQSTDQIIEAVRRIREWMNEKISKKEF